MDYDVDDSRLEEYVVVNEDAVSDGSSGGSVICASSWEVMVEDEEHAGSHDAAVLKAELEDCKREQKRLHRLWSEQLEVNVELQSIKQALSDEIVELSNSLFAEANEMVASEARARNRVELSLEAVRRELQLTKEHLAVERQQLMELRSRLGNLPDLKRETAAAMASLQTEMADDMAERESDAAAKMSLKDQCAGSLNLEYFADLLPGYQFYSRSNGQSSTSGVSIKVWDGICAGIDVEDFASFVRFVQDVTGRRSESLVVMDKKLSNGRLLARNHRAGAGALSCARTSSNSTGVCVDYKRILEHEFVREIEVVDVHCILRLFTCLSKTVRNRLPMAMLRNTITIEVHPQCRLSHSPVVSASSNAKREVSDDKADDSISKRSVSSLEDHETAKGIGDALTDEERMEREHCEEAALHSGSESEGSVSMIESASSSPSSSSSSSAPEDHSPNLKIEDATANSSLRIGEFFKKTFAAMSSTPSLLEMQTMTKDMDRLSLCHNCALCGKSLRWPPRFLHAPMMSSSAKGGDHASNMQSETARGRADGQDNSATICVAEDQSNIKEANLSAAGQVSPIMSNLSSTSLMLSSNATDTFEYLHASLQSSSSVLSHTDAGGVKDSCPIYRLRLTDDSPWMVIDGVCRDRLVALAHYYTFLRHLSRGLFAHRPLIDLYFDLLHLRRNLAYVRLGAGVTAFFIQSDFEHFADRIESLIRPV